MKRVNKMGTKKIPNGGSMQYIVEGQKTMQAPAHSGNGKASKSTGKYSSVSNKC